MTGKPTSKTKVRERERREGLCPNWSCRVKFRAFPQSIRSEVHIISSFGKDAQEFRQNGCL